MSVQVLKVKPLKQRASYKFLIQVKENFSKPLVHKIEFAYDLSKYGHHKQVRDDGRRYFDHPRAVALISMKELKIFDYVLIVSELLHDMPEDSFLLNHYRIREIFGEDIAQIVWLMTKEKKHKGKGIKKYFQRLMHSKNWRAMFAKCLDRLHNMRSLSTCSREKQLKQVKETRLFIYPLLELLLNIVPSTYKEKVEYVKSCLIKLCDHYEKSGTAPKLSKNMIVWFF
jgi:GTP diphosphokinase / guanosine-3',5'-bis(diphosphate) 3'-diphosphatase